MWRRSSHLLQHCRNRHCNKCQSQARERWIEVRKQELLITRYFHVVFTLPHELQALVLQNRAELYNLLFRTVAETLREVARNPKHLGAEIGFFSILHTWGQNLLFHPHLIASFLAVASRRTKRGGFIRTTRSSSQSKHLAKSSAESLLLHCGVCI
jgi:hypothetical protein